MISAANLASARSFSWGNMIPFPPISPHSLNLKYTSIPPVSSAGLHSSGGLFNNRPSLYQKLFELEISPNFGIQVPWANRDYEAGSERKETVAEIYRLNHLNRTYDLVRQMRELYGNLDRREMNIWECCELPNEVVDDSDPDLDAPQIQHLLQSAEATRKDYPDQVGYT